MDRSALLAQVRLRLDARFKDIGPASRFAVPVRGWIKAIRDSLGMSTAQLAARLGISQPSVVQLERSEARGTIELRTLQRVAAALDCTLVYTLVPNRPLDAMVRDRALQVAQRQLRPVHHTMLLEQQSLTPAEAEARLAAYIDELDPRRLWDEQ
jgi:predicted DNA-binding mobile mystery protein A